MKCSFITFFLFLISIPLLNAQIPRPEYPEPQFKRSEWKNLNGTWDFAFDFGETGRERNFHKETSHYNQKITVPFSPESKLSGIEHRGFMPSIWYHRSVDIPSNWDNKRIFLHFGGVDYKTTVWVNGKEAGKHYGGSASFSFEVTKLLKPGQNDIFVQAEDHLRSGIQPGGKQSTTFYNKGCCSYSRVTGIWQTVWLEARPNSYVKKVEVKPDIDNSRFVLAPEIENFKNGQEFKAILFDENGHEISSATTKTNGGTAVLNVKNPELWSPKHPYLYNLKYELLHHGKVLDNIKSYAGLRKIEVQGNKIYLNNKPIFLRFVLDQGFYPDGIWTAPTDQALKKDIQLAHAVGFNGARLHQKVFEARFHYWADKLGYLTWGEFPDWGMNRTYDNPIGWLNLTREWGEVVKQDINHPSIIGWTPMNETHSAWQDYEAYRRAGEQIYDLTKALDPTRPVNDASGFVHIKTDLWTVHDYNQSPETLMKRYKNIHAGMKDNANPMNQRFYKNIPEYDVKYEGQPYLVDEYGGTFWLPSYADKKARGNGRRNWGYGKSSDEVVKLIQGLTKALLQNPKIAGFTFTQLTDVEQEVNGIYTFNRKPKFDQEKLKKAFGGPAAIEKQ